MHVYIYDSFLNQKKYDRILASLETRLTDLGLNGKIARLGLLKNINDIVNYEIKRGARTIIAVGNDQTANQIANVLAETGVPLGIIPIDQDNNQIAKAMGLNSSLEACEALAARLITKIDLGLAGNRYFLSSARITSQGTIIEINQNYSIEIGQSGEVNVFNLMPQEQGRPIKIKSNPQDGKLELMIKTKSGNSLFNKKPGQSLFSIKNIIIKNHKFPLILDGLIKITCPVEIKVIKQKLNVIVGRKRGF